MDFVDLKKKCQTNLKQINGYGQHNRSTVAKTINMVRRQNTGSTYFQAKYGLTFYILGK